MCNISASNCTTSVCRSVKRRVKVNLFRRLTLKAGCERGGDTLVLPYIMRRIHTALCGEMPSFSGENPMLYAVKTPSFSGENSMLYAVKTPWFASPCRPVGFKTRPFTGHKRPVWHPQTACLRWLNRALLNVTRRFTVGKDGAATIDVLPDSRTGSFEKEKASDGLRSAVSFGCCLHLRTI